MKDFAFCKRLTELYLRKNSIDDLKEVRYLAHLQNLRVLWLWDNSCCENKLYRPFIIKTIPSLVKLDNLAITPEERDEAKKIKFTEDMLNAAAPPVSSHSAAENRDTD